MVLDLLKSSGPAVVNSVSAFEIRALAKKKTLRLQGRGLPHRPFTLETSQRSELTWLVGYSTATIQVGGATEEPSTINGKWSDKYLASSSNAADDLGVLGNAFAAIDNAIGAAGAAIGLGSAGIGGGGNDTSAVEWDGTRVEKAADAVDVVDTLVRTAAVCDFVWGRIARRGIIKKMRKSWLNAHDVEWEMELLFTGRTEAEEPVSTPELGVGDTISLFQQLSDSLNLEALPPTFPMANDILADIEAGIRRVGDTTQRLSDTITNITALALSPIAISRSVIALSKTLRGQVDELERKLTRLTAGGMRANKAGAGETTSYATDVTDHENYGGSSGYLELSETSASYTEDLTASEYVARVRGVLREIRVNAILTADSHKKKLERQVDAVVTARAGDDYRKLSQRYYGTPDEWKRIAAANDSETSQLDPGEVIVIPTLTDGDLC